MMKVEITLKALEDLEDLREHLDEEFGKYFKNPIDTDF